MKTTLLFAFASAVFMMMRASGYCQLTITPPDGSVFLLNDSVVLDATEDDTSTAPSDLCCTDANGSPVAGVLYNALEWYGDLGSGSDGAGGTDEDVTTYYLNTSAVSSDANDKTER
jgi:hypothetical protein